METPTDDFVTTKIFWPHRWCSAAHVLPTRELHLSLDIHYTSIIISNYYKPFGYLNHSKCVHVI